MFDQQHLASSPAAGILFLSFLRVWRAHLCCSLSESFIWKLREHHLLSEGTPSAHLSFSITMLFVFCCSLALLISLSFLLRRFSSWLPYFPCHPPSTRWDLCIQEQRLLPRSVEERWPAQLSTFSREERWWIRKLIFSFALWRPHFSFLLSCSLTDRQLLLQGFIFLRIVVWHFSKLLLSIGPFLSSTVYLLLLSYLHASPRVFHCLNYCRGIHSCIYILQNKNCIIKLIMETMIIDCRR